MTLLLRVRAMPYGGFNRESEGWVVADEQGSIAKFTLALIHSLERARRCCGR